MLNQAEAVIGAILLRVYQMAALLWCQVYSWNSDAIISKEVFAHLGLKFLSIMHSQIITKFGVQLWVMQFLHAGELALAP